MKRFAKLGLALAAAAVLPATAAGQAANHVSWGLGGHGPRHWNPFLDGAAAGGGAFFADAGSWSLGVSFGAPQWDHGYDAWGYGYDAWGRDRGHWGHGCDAWGHGYGHYDAFFHCPWAHSHRFPARLSLGWLGWSWMPFASLAWMPWPRHVFAPVVHGPGWGWIGWDPDPFWRTGWRSARFDYARPYFSRGGHVVANRGYRDAGRRGRSVRRSPLFGPRYKETPRVYVTDNGPERPTSRPTPRGRDVNEALGPAGERRGRPSESVRKAKPRGSAGAAPGSARARQPRPEAKPRPGRPRGSLRIPRRPARPSVDPRPPAKVRPVPRGGRRPPSARPAPTSRPPTARPAPASARPRARPATRRTPPTARPAPASARPKARPAPPRRAPPQAKPAPARRPVAKRTPPARRPARKRGK